MKLLLASNTTFLLEKGFGLLGIPKEKMKIAHIMTAAKGATDKNYYKKHQQTMREKGFSFEEVDIEGKSVKELEQLLAGKNVLYVEGGNTFYLLKAVKESGFEKVVRNLIDRGVVYAGVSAGAYITCPTIEISTWGSDAKNRYGLTDLTALNLVPFLLKVHYTDDMKVWLAPKIKKVTYPVRILRDGQGIFVEDGSYRFVGEGEEVIL